VAQFRLAAERPAADPPLRQEVEPLLHLVQPRRARWDEVEVEPGVAEEPLSDLRGLVGRQVVEHEGEVELRRRGPLDRAEEGEELSRSVALVALPEDLPLEDVQAGEEVRRPVPPVVVGLPLGDARAEREDRLRAIEGLNLGLLVDAQDEGVLRRMEVESDDVPQLLLEAAVRAELESLDPVGLEPPGPPDLLHRGVADAVPLGHEPGGPVGGRLRLRLEGVADDRLDLPVGEGRRSPGTRGVGHQSLEAGGEEPAAPEGRGDARRVEFLGDLLVLRSVGGAEDDAGPEDEAEGDGPSAGPSDELVPFVRGEEDGRGDPHGRGTGDSNNKTTYSDSTPLGESSSLP